MEGGEGRWRVEGGEAPKWCFGALVLLKGARVKQQVPLPPSPTVWTLSLLPWVWRHHDRQNIPPVHLENMRGEEGGGGMEGERVREGGITVGGKIRKA